MQKKLLINGRLVAGQGSVEEVLNPATGKVIARVAEASDGQIDAAVRAAEKAFEGWSQTPPKDRSTLLLKLADRIESDGAEYARLESLNCGKPLAAALNDEIPAIADVFRFFAGACRNQHGAVAGEYLAGFTSMIRRDPVGVVASIAPWNYPLMMAAWKLAPALAAGNTVILKPSEQTPLTALKLAETLAEIFPAGVVNVITGRGETVGAPLVGHPRVRMVSLTGDVSTGEKILKAASKGIKRTHLELGGKAPVIVFDDADLESVVSGVRTFGFYNAGQDCTAACRLYAGAKIFDRLVADLSSAAASIKVGKQQDPGVEMGPLISADQRARVAGFVDRAARLKTWKSPPAVMRAAVAASSTSRPSSPAPGRRTKSFAARCSARSCRSRASRTPNRPWPGPTTPSTAWPRPCGRRMSAAPCRWRRACSTAAPGSTHTSCW